MTILNGKGYEKIFMQSKCVCVIIKRKYEKLGK